MTSKGSDQTEYAQADLRLCWSHIPYCWKSHALAQIIYADPSDYTIYKPNMDFPSESALFVYKIY